MQSLKNNGRQSLQFVNETDSIIRESLGSDLYELQGMKRTGTDAGLDDSDSETEVVRVPTANSNGPKPGKKTKGRVKIKMEFIENKLRRYTTFSKRKTGIMKKAYELSTLTGTQVMLLVASETGHVYTFATRKLQPMITSESGKALIQTCLNSPDGASPGTIASIGNNNDQRMNPTGFEETDLTYAITEDESQKSPDSSQKMQYLGSGVSRESSTTPETLGPPQPMAIYTPQSSVQSQGTASQAYSRPSQTIAMTTYLSPQPAVTSAPSPKQQTQPTNLSMQLPTGGIATLLPQASLPPGTPIAVNANQQAGGQQQAATQPIYRLAAGPGGQLGQLISLPGLTSTQQQIVKPEPSRSTVGTTSAASSNTPQPMAMATAGGAVIYQTPQGLVYAAPSSGLSGIPEGYILNLPQPSMVPQTTEQAGPQQQYITIPVPVSLATGQQMPMFQPMLAQAATSGDGQGEERRK